jgi:hypothetical protein
MDALRVLAGEAGEAEEAGHGGRVGRAERVHRGEPCPFRPGFRSRRQPEQRVARFDERMRPRAPRAGRDRSRGHRDGGLDQARDARRRLGVADVGRNRAERRHGPATAPELGERGQFSRIARRGAGALPFDESDVARIDPRLLVGQKRCGAGQRGNQGRRRAPAGYFRVYGHSRRQGVGRAGQDHDAAAFPGQQSGRVGGVHAHLVGPERARSCLQGEPDRVDAEFRSAGDREVKVTRLQGTRGGDDRVQRGLVGGGRIRRARGEAEVLADQVAQARRHARDDQPGPGGLGR